ncbi:hypothetical protein JTE90_006623 [Oedothorax gibbosus]|uniref:PiggyBac transposable element-derived protein 4 C-terminal zinc-ribbon domain-containing protein n=1 Tax=Oedothorax gibbosus TaxID=931172 RepID=A0AAV6U791_9ARAC|nr:hypothetical protein JTE90_006623 [Oedothorax gibbosus]
MSILNAYILQKVHLQSECKKVLTHKDFRKQLIRSMINLETSGTGGVKRASLQSQRISASPQSKKLKGEDHWPCKTNNRRRCAMCSVKGIQRRSNVICKFCNVALCIDTNCYEEYHKLK